jgi:toxin FitB
LSYLVDTNVLSELRRPRPHPAVRDWFAQRPASTLFVSVLTLGEIRKGVQAVADVRRRRALSDWLEADLPAFFTGRVLPVDAGVADRWGRLVAEAGRTLPAIDSLLAATAAAHGLVLVTRNLRDFAGLPVEAFSPWDSRV